MDPSDEDGKSQRKKSTNSSSSLATTATYEMVEGDEQSKNEPTMCGLGELVTSCLAKSPSASSSFEELRIDTGAAGKVICNGNLTQACSSGGTQPFLKASMFTGVPPTIRFYTKGTKVTKPTRKISSKLTWCYNNLLPIVMRHTLAASHFTIVDESLFYIGYWGRHLKSSQYRSLKAHQKVNHFPGAFHIGRKDRLWMHIRNRQQIFGEDFNIIPYTYILPQDRSDLLEYLAEDTSRHVIIKPPASARGTGIQVTRKPKDFPPGNQLVAQHYVDRPLTINGSKFDLRLYVYVPCLEPLRVYVYEQGLVRFASVPYSKCISTVSNKYMHLTNYSINKLAEQDGVADSPVPKWTLTNLWKYFEAMDVDSNSIKTQIEDTIVKAFISCEKPVRDHMAKFIEQGFICHELFGVDILLDEDYKPWLLEVNISPSLHSGTPLDVSVKAPLAKDVLNIAGIYVPPLTDEPTEYMSRPRNGSKSREQLIKEKSWVNAYDDEWGRLDTKILKRLTPEDTRMLVEFEDEYTRRGNFKLIYPTATTEHLLKFFPETVYSNLMLQQWQIEQEEDRTIGIYRLEALCRQGIMNEARSPRV